MEKSVFVAGRLGILVPNLSVAQKVVAEKNSSVLWKSGTEVDRALAGVIPWNPERADFKVASASESSESAWSRNWRDFAEGVEGLVPGVKDAISGLFASTGPGSLEIGVVRATGDDPTTLRKTKKPTIEDISKLPVVLFELVVLAVVSPVIVPGAWISEQFLESEDPVSEPGVDDEHD